MKELDRIGVNHSTIYHELTEFGKYVTKKYKKVGRKISKSKGGFIWVSC